MKQSSARRRPSAALVIGSIALFLALGGTAVALHGHKKVKADDLAKGAVKTGAIRNRAVTPPKTGVVRHSFVAAANATNSHSPVGLGGPQVKVTVPPGALVEVFARASIAVTGNNTAHVDLFGPGVLSNSPSILAGSTNGLQLKSTAPGTNDFDGVLDPTRAGWITIAPNPGHYVFALAYHTSGGTATFQNRSLFVRVIG